LADCELLPDFGNVVSNSASCTLYGDQLRSDRFVG
jgi:hypothetical protein